MSFIDEGLVQSEVVDEDNHADSESEELALAQEQMESDIAQEIAPYNGMQLYILIR